MSSERLSDARLAVLMSHAENFGELLIGPSNLAALVAEVQHYRSEFVQKQIAFAEAWVAENVARNRYDGMDAVTVDAFTAAQDRFEFAGDELVSASKSRDTALLAAAPPKGGER